MLQASGHTGGHREGQGANGWRMVGRSTAQSQPHATTETEGNTVTCVLSANMGAFAE